MIYIYYILALFFCFRFLGLFELPSTTIGIVIFLLGIINFKKNLPFNKVLFLLLICFILNFISCKVYRGQSIIDTFRASNSYMSLALFWYFYKWKVNVNQWEKILWWLCLTFGICYIIQYIAFPTIIFGGQIRVGSEEARMAIVGQGLASFSFIFGLNKYITTHNYKYIVIMLTGLFAVFGCGYRTMLLALIISSIIMLLRLGISFKRMLTFGVMAIILYLFVSNVEFVQDQINNMINRNESLQDSGWENDIRYLNIIYHYTEYFKSPLELLLGSGMPFQYSDYGKFENDVMIDTYGFYYADWGLIGLSWMIGIPTVLVMVYYSFKMFLTKVPKEYFYLGVYFFNIVISSITTHEFYIHENFVVQSILFCVFVKILREQGVINTRGLN